MAFTFAGFTTPSWYGLKGYDSKDVVAIAQPGDQLPSARIDSAGREDGRTYLKMTVGMAPAGTECPTYPAEAVLCPGDEPTRMLIAHHDNSNFEAHDPERRMPIQVTIRDGQLRVQRGGQPSVRAGLVTHAVLMSVAWLLLAPVAVGVQRFAPKGPTSFKVHIYTQIFVVLLTIGGFAGALSSRKGDIRIVAHAIIGLIILGVVVLQACGGFMRPKKAHPPQSAVSDDKAAKADGEQPERATKTRRRLVFELVHKSTGWVMLITALVNCILGASLMRFKVADAGKGEGAQWASMIAAAVMTGLVFIAFAGLELRKRASGRLEAKAVPFDGLQTGSV